MGAEPGIRAGNLACGLKPLEAAAIKWVTDRLTSTRMHIVSKGFFCTLGLA